MLDESEWSSLESCVAILQPFKTYSLKLQSEACTLSDFFGYWISLKLNLSTKNDEFSKELLKQMNERHDVLMNNPILIAAVYLDPRYQRVLRDKKQLAIEVLLNIQSRLNAVQPSTVETASEEACTDLDTLLQHYLNDCDNDTRGTDNVQTIKTILENFYNLISIPVQSSILDFWKRMQFQMPELYALAMIVMAVPPTQTTVERAFSALRILLTSQRTRTDDELLQHMLLLRFNK